MAYGKIHLGKIPMERRLAGAIFKKTLRIVFDTDQTIGQYGKTPVVIDDDIVGMCLRGNGPLKSC